MTDNHDTADNDLSHSADEYWEAEPAVGTESIEAYETEEGVVVFDAQNPLAWVEANRSVRLDELA